MTTTKYPFAITHHIRTNHTCTAICEVWSYQVLGNARDGFEVNYRSCIDRQARIPAHLVLSNVPIHPGAKDPYRSFPDNASFSTEISLSYELDSKTLKEWFPRCRDTGEGDGSNYYFETKSGRPVGEIIIIRWEPAD